jgi:hypothetical protein
MLEESLMPVLEEEGPSDLLFQEYRLHSCFDTLQLSISWVKKKID